MCVSTVLSRTTVVRETRVRRERVRKLCVNTFDASGNTVCVRERTIVIMEGSIGVRALNVLAP